MLCELSKMISYNNTFFFLKGEAVKWSRLDWKRKGDKKWVGCNFKVAIYNCDSFNKLIKWWWFWQWKKKVKNVDFLKSKYYSPPYIYVYAQY